MTGGEGRRENWRKGKKKGVEENEDEEHGGEGCKEKFRRRKNREERRNE